MAVSEYRDSRQGCLKSDNAPPQHCVTWLRGLRGLLSLRQLAHCCSPSLPCVRQPAQFFPVHLEARRDCLRHQTACLAHGMEPVREKPVFIPPEGRVDETDAENRKPEPFRRIHCKPQAVERAPQARCDLAGERSEAFCRPASRADLLAAVSRARAAQGEGRTRLFCSFPIDQSKRLFRVDPGFLGLGK